MKRSELDAHRPLASVADFNLPLSPEDHDRGSADRFRITSSAPAGRSVMACRREAQSRPPRIAPDPYPVESARRRPPRRRRSRSGSLRNETRRGMREAATTATRRTRHPPSSLGSRPQSMRDQSRARRPSCRRARFLLVIFGTCGGAKLAGAMMRTCHRLPCP